MQVQGLKSLRHLHTYNSSILTSINISGLRTLLGLPQLCAKSKFHRHMNSKLEFLQINNTVTLVKLRKILLLFQVFLKLRNLVLDTFTSIAFRGRRTLHDHIFLISTLVNSSVVTSLHTKLGFQFRAHGHFFDYQCDEKAQ